MGMKLRGDDTQLILDGRLRCNKLRLPFCGMKDPPLRAAFDFGNPIRMIFQHISAGHDGVGIVKVDDNSKSPGERIQNRIHQCMGE